MSKKEIKEEIMYCHDCSHKKVCYKFKLVYGKYKRGGGITYKELGETGKKYNCKNFSYKNFETYNIEEFKDLLKRKIDVSSAYPLLALYEILKMLEKREDKSNE